jgi:hypothetical protein
MNNTLNASPKTPLAQRLKAEGRLLLDDWAQDDFSHQVKAGATNFRPLRMTMEELTQGQKRLIRKLYEPQAFLERLLGNLSRFRGVRVRRQPLDSAHLMSFVRLVGFFWGQGSQSRKFFWRALWSTFRQSPRSLMTMIILLGKYAHILQLNGFAQGGPAPAALDPTRNVHSEKPVAASFQLAEPDLARAS